VGSADNSKVLNEWMGERNDYLLSMATEENVSRESDPVVGRLDRRCFGTYLTHLSE
jgi:hypothetical protein